MDATRIAVIIETDIFDRKGLFNAVHGRIRALEATGRFKVDPFCIQCRETALSRKVKKLPRRPRVDELTVDGKTYRLLWYRFSLLDWFFVEKLHRRPLFFPRFASKAAACLEGYPLVSAHSFTGALIASEASHRSGSPFFVTWHGSDVNVYPWRNRLLRQETERLTSEVAANFYVSRALMEKSAPFPGRKEVLRNGIGPEFTRFGDDRRSTLRQRYGLSARTRVVAYAGHFFHIKNTLSLPGIFREVRSLVKEPLVFWLIGDGKEFRQVRDLMVGGTDPLNCVFWGNRDAAEMPDLLNCIDVLVLPSFNEGLPLITMEALSCGCQAVGSRVGGIPEILGEENTVPLGPGFARSLAALVAERLKAPSDQLAGRDFGWEDTAAKECDIYEKWLNSEHR